MPENETLDLRTREDPRWRRIREQLASSQTPVDCFPVVQREFYLGLGRFRKYIASDGVNLEALLKTAHDNPSGLDVLVARTRHHGHARCLLQAAKAGPYYSFDRLIRAWLDSIWDSIRDLVDVPSNSLELNCQIESMLRRIAQGIVADPSRIPRLPRESASHATLSDLLARPLL